MIDYAKFTDQERMQALWSHSLQIERLKKRRKILKDNPPTDQMAAEWQAQIDNVANEIKLARSEIKALWKAVMA